MAADGRIQQRPFPISDINDPPSMRGIQCTHPPAVPPYMFKVAVPKKPRSGARLGSQNAPCIVPISDEAAALEPVQYADCNVYRVYVSSLESPIHWIDGTGDVQLFCAQLFPTFTHTNTYAYVRVPLIPYHVIVNGLPEVDGWSRAGGYGLRKDSDTNEWKSCEPWAQDGVVTADSEVVKYVPRPTRLRTRAPADAYLRLLSGEETYDEDETPQYSDYDTLVLHVFRKCCAAPERGAEVRRHHPSTCTENHQLMCHPVRNDIDFNNCKQRLPVTFKDDLVKVCSEAEASLYNEGVKVFVYVPRFALYG